MATRYELRALHTSVEFHARSLAALERTRGLRDDAFLVSLRLQGVRMTLSWRRLARSSGWCMPRGTSACECSSRFRAAQCQICIDIDVSNAQYLGVMVVLLLKVAQHSGFKGPW